MAKYYRRPDGLYETTRTVRGKRIRFRGRTCAEVDRKILEYREEEAKGRNVPVIADEWYEEKCREVRNATRNAYSFALARIKKAFPGRAGKVTPMDVRRYLKAFEAQGYAKATVSTELSVLKAIFAHAVLAGDIAVSPAAEVKKSRGLPQVKRNALTEEQEAKVEACRTGDWWLLGLMLLYTGCRRGELLALEWRDIDREAGVIHIDKKLDYSYGGTPVLEHRLKSENGRRDIPLLEPLARALPRNRIGKIFPGRDGGYLTTTELKRAWEQYLQDAGIEGVTPHCFRHSFATLCFEAGMDPKDAAAVLGDTEQITRTIYTEVRKSRQLTNADKLNALLETREQARGAKAE